MAAFESTDDARPSAEPNAASTIAAATTRTSIGRTERGNQRDAGAINTLAHFSANRPSSGRPNNSEGRAKNTQGNPSD